MDLYSIPNWDRDFETLKTRKLGRLRYLPIRLEMYESVYRDLGPAIAGTWAALIALAARSPVRGELRDLAANPLPKRGVSAALSRRFRTISAHVDLLESSGWLEKKSIEVRRRRQESISSSSGAERKPPGREDLAWVSGALRDYMGGDDCQWPVPDEAICQRIIAATRGRPLEELRELLRSKYYQGLKPGKSWGWFLAIVEAHYGQTA